MLRTRNKSRKRSQKPSIDASILHSDEESMFLGSCEQTPELDRPHTLWGADELGAFEEHERFRNASLVYIEKLMHFQPADKPKRPKCQLPTPRNNTS